MGALYLESTGNFSEWDGVSRINGITYQPNIGDLWPAEELAARGLYAPLVPNVPTGKVVTGQRVGRVDGVVTFIYTLEDAPGSVDAQFPALQPWQFWSIIDLSGIGEQALYDAIDLIPDEAFKVIAKRKLSNPPGGVFKRSDPLFSNSFLMMQLSKSKADIDALWTQGLALE